MRLKSAVLMAEMIEDRSGCTRYRLVDNPTTGGIVLGRARSMALKCLFLCHSLWCWVGCSRWYRPRHDHACIKRSLACCGQSALLILHTACQLCLTDGRSNERLFYVSASSRLSLCFRPLIPFIRPPAECQPDMNFLTLTIIGILLTVCSFIHIILLNMLFCVYFLLFLSCMLSFIVKLSRFVIFQ